MSSITMHILENQKATIMVRSTRPITLKFSRMIVHIKEVDGCVVLKQCPKSEETDVLSDPDVVAQYAGGSFDQVNEQHASEIEEDN
jgi:hypothetical protein